MTAQNFPAALAAILKYEGGFSNDPQDPGGATNLGVTLYTLSQFEGRQAMLSEVHALTPEKVAPIYRANYWNAIHGDNLPAGVDLIVFDTCVNSGPGRAAKLLQQAVGVDADGAIGPATIRAAQTHAAADTIDRFSALHETFYRSLPTFGHFGAGWMNRLHAVKALAHQWADQ